MAVGERWPELEEGESGVHVHHKDRSENLRTEQVDLSIEAPPISDRIATSVRAAGSVPVVLTQLLHGSVLTCAAFDRQVKASSQAV